MQNELHIHSPHTVRRLFTLFDRDVTGDVMMREFASGFFLLCGGVIMHRPRFTPPNHRTACGALSALSFLRQFSTLQYHVMAVRVGSYREKIAEAFNLFDLDGNGYLHPVELDMLLDSFYVGELLSTETFHQSTQRFASVSVLCTRAMAYRG
eukprot:SAG11_NODE_6674_length_1270_cov_0.831768_2_plen_152_part_00